MSKVLPDDLGRSSTLRKIEESVPLISGSYLGCGYRRWPFSLWTRQWFNLFRKSNFFTHPCWITSIHYLISAFLSWKYYGQGGRSSTIKILKETNRLFPFQSGVRSRHWMQIAMVVLADNLCWEVKSVYFPDPTSGPTGIHLGYLKRIGTGKIMVVLLLPEWIIISTVNAAKTVEPLLH